MQYKNNGERFIIMYIVWYRSFSFETKQKKIVTGQRPKNLMITTLVPEKAVEIITLQNI